MKAVQFFTNGNDPKIVDCEKPTLKKPDQVLIKVVVAAIDTALKELVEKGAFAQYIHSTKDPLYLGWHFSGRVEAKGEEVTGMDVDNEVFGFLQYEPTQDQGSFAEYIVVNFKECAIKPKNISHKIAAASSTESITALQAMRDIGELGENKSILIVGAGGGVGSLAVTIAKYLGAKKVTAVCSTKDVERVRKLGADVVIDRKKTDPLKVDDQFDVVFDTPCAYGANQCLSLLKNKGHYVTTLINFGFVLGKFLTLLSSKSVTMVSAKSRQADLMLLSKWLEEGLEITVDSTFPITDMKGAYNRQNAKDKLGRVVVEVEGKWE